MDILQFLPLTSLVGMFIVGLGLGLFYFVGLWLTLQRIARSGQPALLVLSSFLGRSALCVGVIYAATGGQWERVLICMAGFVAMRIILTRRFGLQTGAMSSSAPVSDTGLSGS